MTAFGPFLFFLLLGAALIVAEILIFNLSIFWFLFVGLGALVAALVSWMFPESSWLLAIVTFTVATTLIAVALYRPLKRFQNKKGPMAGNDALGQSVEVLDDLTDHNQGKVTWSGTSWSARLAQGSESLKKGEQAEIVEVQGIVLLVRKKSW